MNIGKNISPPHLNGGTLFYPIHALCSNLGVKMYVWTGFAGIHMEIVLYIWDAAMVTVELHALNSNLEVWNMLQSCGDPNV